jgi:uncharacterized GH25 family protein
MIQPRGLLFIACIWIFNAEYVQAHDFWLEPNTFSAEEGDAVDVSLRFGVGFEGSTLPYLSHLFTDFSLLDRHGRKEISSVQGSDPAASLLATSGAQLIGYRSQPQFIELDATTFKEYVEEEGVEYILSERERRGQSDDVAPEEFVRLAKLLLQSGTPDQDLYKQKLGYTLELVPLSDPYKLKPGDSLEFELLYQDEVISGLQLQAMSKADPESVQKIRTDENGRASITVDKAGPWLVKVVMIVPVPGRYEVVEGASIALWQSYWASFVFALTES